MQEACSRFRLVKVPRVDNLTANRCTVAAVPLCRRVNNDVSTERHNRTPEPPCPKGIVDQKTKTVASFPVQATFLQHTIPLWALHTTIGT
jgi:hypothetical protein